MALPRGFKSEAERIARQVQAELGMHPDQSVSPRALAELLGVDIRAGDELIPRKRFEELEEMQSGAFSACTFKPSPDRLVVVYNPLSWETRQTSDLAHELSHILLGHELSRIEKLGDITFFSCDAAQEEEAAWLSGCLLLPRAFLLAATRRGLSVRTIAKQCRLSERIVQYRINATGVARQNEARLRKSRAS